MARGETSGTGEAHIPAAAAAIIDLLNSRAHGTPPLPDALDSPETAREVLAPFAPADPSPMPPRELARVRAVRSALMAIVAAGGTADTAQDWEQVTGHAATVSLQQVFTPEGRVDLRQTAGDPVIGRITLTVAELLTSGTWSRIRACANDLCTHVFYDTTRSRTGRWHSYEVCGNRTNVAAFRARRARRSDDPVGGGSA
jgi:predicted RNA-binding Zn ribbon-like protein